MECYKHKNESAIGLCKSCFKAVCRNCTIELIHGLACSEDCATDVNEYNQMNERGKIIYGIGSRKSNVPATGVILWILLSLLMWGVFLVPYFMKNKVIYENLVIAMVFSLIAGIVYYSSKRTGLQC